MTSCRATEGLYVTLTDNLGEDGKVSDEFVAEFKRQATIGLPIVKEKRSKFVTICVNVHFY